MTKFHIKKGDTVVVLAGEDKGKTGKVLKMLLKKERAIVEGVNIVSKSAKPSAKNPQGGITKVEAPIHISNLSLIDPKSGKPTRIRIERVEDGPVKTNKDGSPKLKKDGTEARKVRILRIAKKSGQEIK